MAHRRNSTAAALQALAQRHQLAGAAGQRHAELTRRQFIERLGAAAAALGVPPLIAGCGGGDDEAPPAPPVTEGRTLFFNFAHLKHAHAMSHVLMAGGKRFPLTRVADKPAVLAAARQGNELLRGVPDEQITHHVEGATFSTTSVTLCYVMSGADETTGAWQMTSMYFNIPSAAVAHAYAQARARTATGALPISGKRHRYQLRAATSAQDMLDEHALVDSSSHAEALVGLHPEVLSLEPNSAAHIHHNIISVDSNTQFLAEAVLPGMGPAVPQGTADPSQPTPWASLVPMSDTSKSPPVPWKMSDGKLNQYYPDWDPAIDQSVAPAMQTVHPLVKNDETLGIDVTGGSGSAPPTAQQLIERSGKLWARHDGRTSFARSAVASATQASSPSVKYTAQQPAISPGLVTALPQDSDYTVLGDGRVQVKLDIAYNWFLRWLTMYVQFVNLEGQVIKTSALPNDTVANQPGPHPGKFDPDDTVVFVDLIAPAVTVLGVPVSPGSAASTITIPTDAQELRIYYGSPASYPNYPPELGDTDVTFWAQVMTYVVNYGLTGIFMAAGAATDLLSATVRLVISLGGGLVVREILAIVTADEFNGQNSVPALATIMNIVKGFFTYALGPALTSIIGAITAELAAAEIIDSIPIAGQIARAIVVVAGTAEILQTTIEIAASPLAYLFSISLSHDLAVTVLPDGNNTQFPQLPPGYTLYYKVTYMFDSIDAAPHVVDAVDVPDPTVKSIAVLLPGIPRGGQVNINIGFYARSSGTPAGQNDWCAGFGTTGLTDNTVDRAPDIRITEVKVPIQASTRYLHTRKVTLDGQGRHVWTATAAAPPYIAPPGGQGPGLGEFNGITVRQGRTLPPQQGYVGYAWKAFSSGVNGCSVSAPGQLDLLANLNTDADNMGANAQNGYARSACGQQPGVRIAYNLMSHDVKNCYLDSDALHIRPVALDPPAFPDPRTTTLLSFGQLNTDSDRLLLHPQGHAVSINNANDLIEMVRLAPAAVDDAVATARFRARLTAGTGSRPGRVTKPVAAAVSPEGVILVLEDAGGNNRIQAFDLGGNPVAYFSKQAKPYFLQLSATPGVQYLDLAVEFSGYLYVLSEDGSHNHRLDIYHPQQIDTQPICTTQGINAANLTVDFWRNVYTLNYEVLTAPDGTLPAFTEPSVSLWVPPPPV